VQNVIAIVEHDEMLRAALSDLLRSSGHQVAAFGSPKEFIERTQIGRVAGIIADVEMPGVSCLELAHMLSFELDRVPLIFITAQLDAFRTLEAAEAGVVALLQKPFKPSAFLYHVARAFGPAPPAT
jgi:FixJ family two-component response regulator